MYTLILFWSYMNHIIFCDMVFMLHNFEVSVYIDTKTQVTLEIYTVARANSH